MVLRCGAWAADAVGGGGGGRRRAAASGGRHCPATRRRRHPATRLGPRHHAERQGRAHSDSRGQPAVLPGKGGAARGDQGAIGAGCGPAAWWRRLKRTCGVLGVEWPVAASRPSRSPPARPRISVRVPDTPTRIGPASRERRVPPARDPCGPPFSSWACATPCCCWQSPAENCGVRRGACTPGLGVPARRHAAAASRCSLAPAPAPLAASGAAAAAKCVAADEDAGGCKRCSKRNHGACEECWPGAGLAANGTCVKARAACWGGGLTCCWVQGAGGGPSGRHAVALRSHVQCSPPGAWGEFCDKCSGDEPTKCLECRPRRGKRGSLGLFADADGWCQPCG